MFEGHENGSAETHASTEELNVVEDFSSLCLSDKYPDVTFFVGGVKLFAHKVILAHRNKKFDDMFEACPKENELIILNTSPEAFRVLLKYIYTTNIVMKLSDIDLILEVCILARVYSPTNLTADLVREVTTILDAKTAVFFINGANKHDLAELRDACHLFMDDNAQEILSSDVFTDLTQESVYQILKRDTFVAPEMEIFEGAAKWCKKNNHAGSLISECVRLPLLTVTDIIATVWPTNLVSDEELLEAILKITSDSSKDSLRRAVLSAHGNTPAVQKRLDAIFNYDINRLTLEDRGGVQHTIDGKSYIVISLSEISRINHIRIMLDDSDYQRYYSYYIETSLDRKKWHRIIDYSTYACRSLQMLWFEQHMVEYIKIVGTSCSDGSHFDLRFFEALYKTRMPKIINTLISPTVNVATDTYHAIVVKGTNRLHFLKERRKNKIVCMYHFDEPKEECLMFQLAQPYMISSMRFLLLDSTVNKYFIETSVNKADWEIVIDKTKERCSGLQDLHFEERAVVFIKMIGTFSCSVTNDNFLLYKFGCSYFECPSQAKK